MKRFWDGPQLADCLNVKNGWVYDRTGGNGPEIIPHLKLGKYIRFDPEFEEFRNWLRDHEVGPDGDQNVQNG